jgi:hypothetical protein
VLHRGMAIVAAATLLAACGKSSTTPDPADFARQQMRADLTRLMTAEQTYHTAHGVYTTSGGALAFVPTIDVTAVLAYADSTGYGARASHNSVGTLCGVYVGPAVPSFTATLPGVTLTAGQIGCQ